MTLTTEQNQRRIAAEIECNFHFPPELWQWIEEAAEYHRNDPKEYFLEILDSAEIEGFAYSNDGVIGWLNSALAAHHEGSLPLPNIDYQCYCALISWLNNWQPLPPGYWD